MPIDDNLTVFVLQHVHDLGDDDEDVKFIGVYSTMKAAEAAVTRARTLPGFSDTPDGFAIDAYVVDQDHWQSGYVTSPCR
ncbi:MAG TPA: hypothetical protein VG248_14940 [Caulobacteraceae bacterium]|jgi:hypothetical protein|nr:hypothetical protein [Caulobacteraceae bacterium]